MTTVLPADKFDTAMTFVKPDPAPTRVPLDKLAVLPGFNTRVKDDEYNERVTTIAESIIANGFFDDKPFAVVMIEGDDTVYIYDGEHRFDAAKQASLDTDFPDGLPVAWAKDGATVRDLTIHLAHGNNGERLNMVELAAVVRRMQGLDMTKDEIATALGRTARHVDNLFVLAGANQTVKKAVASGQIAGAEAVKLLRKDPKTAAAKITEAVKKAAEKGKAKATPKTMKSDAPTGPKMKVIEIEQSVSEGETMGAVLKALAGKLREHVKIGEDDILAETGMIRVKLSVIDHEAEAAKADRERQKAEAAAERQRQKDEAAAKKAAEKQAADERRAAEAKLLAEAATKGSEAKKPATPKKVATPKKAADKGLAASGAKTPVKAKPAKAPEKPAEADSADDAAPGAPEAGSAAPAPESGQDENNGL